MGDTSSDLPEGYVRSLLAEMPKVELHLHLDGGLRVSTALELARESKSVGAATYREMYEQLVLSGSANSQAELLQAFRVPIELMQTSSALERATFEFVVDKYRDSVIYIEIKWAPAQHTRRGLSLDDGIAAVAAGAARGTKATGCVALLVPVIVRTHDPELNREVVRACVRTRDLGVVAVDLAGDEAACPLIDDHRPALEDAIAAGLGITVHAGEIADDGRNMASALSLSLHRIEHGSSVVPGSKLADTLRKRGITLDMCPTSNVQAATVPTLADHPIMRLHREGVSVTVSTDDPTISAITQTEEMWNLWRWCGATLPEIWTMNRTAVAVAFAPDPVKAELDAVLDRWQALVPDVMG
ncbi:adenosine deaminase [soil metagenome]